MRYPNAPRYALATIAGDMGRLASAIAALDRDRATLVASGTPTSTTVYLGSAQLRSLALQARHQPVDASLLERQLLGAGEHVLCGCQLHHGLQQVVHRLFWRRHLCKLEQRFRENLLRIHPHVRFHIRPQRFLRAAAVFDSLAQPLRPPRRARGALAGSRD